MKVLGLLLILYVLSINAIDNDELTSKWIDFQNKFGKSYKSHVEHKKRFNIFAKNVEKIEAHNVRYENGEVSFQKGINQFTDLTFEEFMEFVKKGGFQPKIEEAELHVSNPDDPIPESVDWREKNCVTPAKSQGPCGSCWSFSAAGAVEGQLAIKGKGLISLSEQNLVDCSQVSGNYGCGGGWMSRAFEYIKNYGIESEKDYPYTFLDQPCQANESKIVTKVSGYKNITQFSEKDLTHAIATIGPVSVGIDVCEDFWSYRHGIIYDNACLSDVEFLDHAVLAVGYGTENGMDYYIIKNSWGENWGEGGYARMVRNRDNNCGIATLASYPIL